MSNNVEKVKRIQRGVSTLSSLQVDSISSMGGGHVDGAGLVVQYVETSDDNVASGGISTNSTSFVSTGITLSFTPEFIGSKVCVDYVGSMGSATGNTAMAITLYKDGTQAMGGFGLGFVDSQDGYVAYGKTGGQYIFTTTSLTTIEFTVYARKSKGTGSVTPVFVNSSYTLSATEIAQ